MRVSVDGTTTDRLLDGIINPAGAFKWSGFIREPVVSPDGRYVAIATDLPDPTSSDVILKLFDLKTNKVKDLEARPGAPLGHQDPAWKPDGSRLLYVRNDRDGAQGTPRIYSWNPDTGKARSRDRARLPASLVVARRPVLRGDPDLGLRHRRRDPQRHHRRRGHAHHGRRRQLGPRLVARAATRSPSSTSPAGSSTSGWSSSGGVPRTGR